MFLPVRRPTASIGMAISQPFPNATSVVVGDFNSDNKLDVAWTDSTRCCLCVSLGNGKGGFDAAITNTGFAVPPSQMFTGDFNGDGRLDIIGNSGSLITVLLGNGDGTFNGGWIYHAFDVPVFIATVLLLVPEFPSTQVIFRALRPSETSMGTGISIWRFRCRTTRRTRPTYSWEMVAVPFRNWA